MPVIISFKARGVNKFARGHHTELCDFMIEAASRDEAYAILSRRINGDPRLTKMVWDIQALSVVSQPGGLPSNGFDSI